MKRDATVMPCRWGKKRTSSGLEELAAKRMELKERELRLKETGLLGKKEEQNLARVRMMFEREEREKDGVNV